MRIIITGGSGFLGTRLARRILDPGVPPGAAAGALEAVDELLLFDLHPGDTGLADDPRVRIASGDIADRDTVFDLFDRADVAVFHLASVVSGAAEIDFEGALRTNLDGTRNLLDACRLRAATPRVVFASSVAVFGGPVMPGTADDNVRHTPQGTYGATKAIGELLINDYTRKGYIDGRAARLPTIIIRPGAPNRAASGFASALFREPLNGVPCTLPVTPDTRMVVLGYRAAVAGLLHLLGLPGHALGCDRALNFPGLSVSVGEMMEALDRVAPARGRGAIDVRPDPAIAAIVSTWPCYWQARRAATLGFPETGDLDRIIHDYCADYLPGK